MHRGAKARCVDLILGHSGQNQVIGVGAGDIEGQRRAAHRTTGRGRGQEPAIDQIALMASCCESVDEFGPDFVAAGADTRADGDHEVTRARAEFACQRIDGGDGDPRRGPAPSGMHSSYDASDPIRHQERNAVRGADGNGNICCVRDQRIGLGPGVRYRRSFSNEGNFAPMHLRDRRHLSSSDGVGERAHVLRR
jgi:hypothetical protein